MVDNRTCEFECVECLTHEDCGAASPKCVEGDCEECIQNTDCRAGQICNDDLECETACARLASEGGTEAWFLLVAMIESSPWSTGTAATPSCSNPLDA